MTTVGCNDLPPARAERGIVDFTTTVPPAILTPPFRHELRHLERGEAALIVDRYLRALACHDTTCRAVLGRVAAAFLKRAGHHRLGFARLGDYTRERLGISARELQSAAHVATAMRELPAVAAAFESGDISWTQARLLAAIATPATEARWVAIARQHTVRALQERIRRARRDGGSGDELGGSAQDDPGTTSDAHPGHVGPVFAETGIGIADDEDGALLDGEPQVGFRLLCPRRLRAEWRRVIECARRMAGEPLPVWQAAEAIAAEALSGAARAAGGAEDAAVKDAPGSAEVCHGYAEGHLAGSGTWVKPKLQAELDEPVGEGERVGAGAPDETPDSSETRAVFWSDLDWSRVEAAIPSDVADLAGDDADAFSLDARLRATMQAMHRIDWQAGRLLRFFFDLRLYRLLGFATAARYVQERLGMSIRKVQTLIAVERVTWRAPHLMQAYANGRVSALRALTIAPVLSATHERAWLARAGEVTLRRLADEVDWALTVQDLRPLCEAVAPPPAGRLEIPAAQMGAHLEDTGVDAVITFRGPASVVALLRDAIATYTAPAEPAWRGLRRILEHVRAEWDAQPRHHDPVFARDRWRCTVPICTARRNLHDHHLVFRSRGGDNGRGNRTTVCAWHHLRAIHRGYVRASGMAPDVIEWNVGVRPDGPPLMRLIGDRYVNTEATASRRAGSR